MTLSLLMVGGLLLSACVDNKYDLSDVDATIGIGSDGLSIPTSSTDTIKLDDALDLEDDDCVTIDEDGNYVFTQTGNDVEPSKPSVKIIEVNDGDVNNNDFEVFKAMSNVPSTTLTVKKENTVAEIYYTGEKHEEVIDMDTAYVDEDVTLELDFSQIRSYIKNNKHS